MAIVKSKNKKSFSSYDNAIWNEKEITNESKLVLLYLLSKPPNWKPNRQEIRSKFNLGKQKVDKIFNNLIQVGYIEMIKINGEKGYEYDYVVYEDKNDNWNS